MIRSEFVDAGGIRTHYLEAGAGEPLLLLHGGQAGALACAEDWRPALEPLGRHFRVLAIDKVGCGFSDNPTSDAGYMLAATVDHARAFLQALGIARAHVAGHSRGGYGAVRLALEHPDMVATLINVASGTLMGGPTPYAEWGEKLRAMQDPRERVRFIYAVNSYSAAHIDASLLDAMCEVQAGANFKIAHQRAQQLSEPFTKAMHAETAEARGRIAAGGIAMPTLLVWGFNDPSATYATKGVQAIELFLSSVERAEAHVMNRAGHYTYREHPQAFADALVSFINANKPHRALVGG
jgi:pimeloyl-ACP methyl ester carboxylesterase